MLLDLGPFYADNAVTEGDTIMLFRDLRTNALIVHVERAARSAAAALDPAAPAAVPAADTPAPAAAAAADAAAPALDPHLTAAVSFAAAGQLPGEVSVWGCAATNAASHACPSQAPP